ncbi:methyltransferase domain-containing protein [Nocardia otitidiscaviarum]|uniref:Methyltransferase domain-containing protein n=1 Tax=Nocardia otitidiscaviarum TaxID=1823 RepID=A0A516NN33_9NOCA|nr:methyltransferase domain-containing protein [Nocardia otitidiscaviarum]MCP9624429.1 methyltransferase domain-containing protein [Nocardia otitidiscaviarum]QDP80318.1 methyltransferase domain-containing protein [Nocardia otitidiscaviarum]
MTEHTAGPSFHADRIGDDEQQEFLVEVLDAQAALPGVRRLREWTRAALRIAAGDRTLDIGSGTGSEVLAMARPSGPGGAAVGVDPNPGMLAEARARAAAAGIAAEFVEGNGYALPFPDDSFDAVRCERVFQHLDHPERATAEIARVLRPGGRVALVDSDWSTAIIHPGDPDVVAALLESWLSHTANRHSGRHLPGLLTAAGLTVDDIGADAVVWDRSFIDTMLTAGLDQAVAAGAVTPDQRDRFLSDLTRGAEVGDYHCSVTMFAVVAHLP